MGLEDRDWYREEPSKAWNSQRQARWHAHDRGDCDTTGGGFGIHGAALPAIAVSAALIALGWLWNPFALPLPRVSDQPDSPLRAGEDVPASAPIAPESGKIVRLVIRPGLDRPATRVMRWTITDPRFGTIEVVVPVGSPPREALTVALAARGYQVIP